MKSCFLRKIKQEASSESRINPLSIRMYPGKLPLVSVSTKWLFVQEKNRGRAGVDEGLSGSIFFTFRTYLMI